MTFITVETKIEVDTKVFGDIAITAAEGGIGHWAVIDEYKPSRWVLDYVSGAQNVSVPEDFVFYTIQFENPTDDKPPFLTAEITPELLAKGLGLLMRVRPFTDTDQISEADALAADEIVQYGVFGELVYS